MKHLKKIVSLLLTAVMVLAMCIPVMAANVDITDHEFEAYQIFTGDLDGKKLSNIEWGNGVKKSDLLAETALAGCTTATEVADKLIGESPEISSDDFIKLVSKHLTNAKTSGTGSIALPAAGYYLIKDISDVQGKDNAKNLTLLKVSAAETVTPQVKTDKPTPLCRRRSKVSARRPYAPDTRGVCSQGPSRALWYLKPLRKRRGMKSGFSTVLSGTGQNVQPVLCTAKANSTVPHRCIAQ